MKLGLLAACLCMTACRTIIPGYVVTDVHEEYNACVGGHYTVVTYCTESVNVLGQVHKDACVTKGVGEVRP